MEIIIFNQAKDDLKRVLDRVIDDADYTIITQQDGKHVVVISRDFFDALLETGNRVESSPPKMESLT